MHKELFFELFNFIKETSDKYEKYYKFMKTEFDEEINNFWIQSQIYNHCKRIFNIYYNDPNDDFGYFTCESELGKHPGEVTYEGKTYILDSIESFYNYCEEMLEKK